MGCFGLVGSGRTELARAIFGVNKILSGEITYKDKKIKLRNINDAVKSGIGLVPEDRKNEALLPNMSVTENITISIIKNLSKWLLILKNREKIVVKDIVKKLKIIAPLLTQKVVKLSGGNQQKIVMAKWLLKESEILILDQPTRGIDVASKMDIYKIIIDLAERGHAIFLISDDLEEIINLSDRIVVMHNGIISGIVNKKEITKKTLLHLAYGGIKKEA
ncbi:MAG: ATP-binding cassette domain-containing protein [Actinobacteria bacterium]|nr:ATP-binding cassette domain-containing protein [Actinomycetota bacterium]